jgi:hypothetical protein
MRELAVPLADHQTGGAIASPLSLIFEPGANTSPGFGLCFTTLPVFAVAQSIFSTCPIPQSADRERFLEALSFFPVSLGTTQCAGRDDPPSGDDDPSSGGEPPGMVDGAW